jgi:antitoxin MazE
LIESCKNHRSENRPKPQTARDLDERFYQFGVEAVALPRVKIYNFSVYLGGSMQVSKWGNSLAVRLPSTVVEALDLKEGDQIEIRIAGKRVFEVRRDQSKQLALARLRKLRRPLPPGFVFDREDANAR